MGWRYKAGLFLIAAVVIIWVTSAEVTQVIINLFFIFFPFIYSLFLLRIGLLLDIWLNFPVTNYAVGPVVEIRISSGIVLS
jgi:hypothetical protein